MLIKIPITVLKDGPRTYFEEPYTGGENIAVNPEKYRIIELDEVPEGCTEASALDLEEALADKKASLTDKVHTYFQGLMDANSKAYTQYELETFQAQRDEWLAWTRDNTVLTPAVDAMASARGIPKEELMGKIGVKVLMIFSALGQQQALEAQIAAAGSISELRALQETIDAL